MRSSVARLYAWLPGCFLDGQQIYTARRDAAAFLVQLLNPAAQKRLRDADRPAGIDVTIALVED
ncbi:hypothetical protein PSO31014_01012 [Pandoraea soli]|uniref:Uncharacterized protein n=1 Tax=Pandoraea soli TaxID=2508293 RepID=A0ABY6VRD4_9BURK|nr:hypothetical protein PSO31014_01012 [Pandoraea soli]